MKDTIAGTYWMVKWEGHRHIVRGPKPFKDRMGWITSKRTTMGWLCIEPGCTEEHHRRVNTIGDNSITSKDFSKVKFPDITEEESPVEIEITKSGRVYRYES